MGRRLRDSGRESISNSIIDLVKYTPCLGGNVFTMAARRSNIVSLTRSFEFSYHLRTSHGPHKTPVPSRPYSLPRPSRSKGKSSL